LNQDNKLHVGYPRVHDRKRLHKYLDGILDKNWLTNNGPLVRKFERQLAKYLDVRHVIATCNGTIALQIALWITRRQPNVIVPSWTHPAGPMSIKWLDLTPVFCDVDETHNINPALVEKLINPSTTTILATHLWGREADADALEDLARITTSS